MRSVIAACLAGTIALSSFAAGYAAHEPHRVECGHALPGQAIYVFRDGNAVFTTPAHATLVCGSNGHWQQGPQQVSVSENTAAISQLLSGKGTGVSTLQGTWFRQYLNMVRK
jgi:hypothetical protein